MRPLTPLPLPEHAQVRLSVEDGSADDRAAKGSSDDERAQWLAQSEQALMKVWNDAGDDVFNDLLTP